MDLAGQESQAVRRAIAVADAVVSPVDRSPAELDALGRVDPVTRRFEQAGPFAEIVAALRAERMARGQPGFDWVVAKNRVRRSERRLIAAVDANLATISRHLGFRMIDGLTERVAYRELLAFGLTQFDLRLIPDLGAARSTNLRELRAMVDGLHLPSPVPPARTAGITKVGAPVPLRTAQNYRE